MSSRILTSERGTVLESGRHAGEVLRRIRAEFEEMPDLRLTAPQAARLFGIEPRDCAFLLGGLVVTGFLRMQDTEYIRASN